MDKSSLTPGWLVGRQIAGQRTKQKTPIAYLYNGKRLPPLPEWDKETFPSAFIVYVYEGKYRFFASKSSAYVTSGNDGNLQINFETPFLFVSCNEDDELWGNLTETSVMNFTTLGDEPFLWANHDVYKGSTLYLAASDPIPVYE